MSNNKRYRLRMDLPGASKGELVLPTSAIGHGIIRSGEVHLEWGSDFVRNNPKWFKELAEPEPTVIDRLERHEYCNVPYWYQFESNNEIPEDKFPLIKNAIEFAINNEPDEIKIGDHTFKFQQVQTEAGTLPEGGGEGTKQYIKKLEDRVEGLEIIHEAFRLIRDRKYTQEQLDKAVHDGIKAASMELPYAVGRLVGELSKDKEEGSYYYAWQANIAMAFYDEWRTEFGYSEKISAFIHEVANNAAKRFLDSLCHVPQPEKHQPPLIT